MTAPIKQAIDAADANALQARITADPTLVNQPVRFGENNKNVVPPLHYICDVVFRGDATPEQSLAMARVLLKAGVDVNEGYATTGDTYLITAASLGAEAVGLLVLEHGADVSAQGLFGASALHWAAFMGLDQLAEELLKHGANLELCDNEYDCSPLQWALYAWTNGSNGRRDGIPRVAAILVTHGATVPQDALAKLTGDADEVMRDALRRD